MPVGLVVKVGADVTGLMGAFQAAAGGAAGLGDALKATIAQTSPMGAAAVAAADAIAGMTKAAADDRAEQEKLAAVYAAAGAATGDYNTAIQAAIDLGAAKAFSDSEVRAGLQDLVTATGSAAEANKLLGPAMDLARLAGVDLETASKALAKAQQGQDAQLVKLIPGLEKGKTATDTIANATKLAAGQADLYAESSEGMQKKGSDAFSELGETIGSAFLPIMDELLPAIGPFVELLGELLKLVLPPLKVAIGLVVEALKIMVTVLKQIVDWVKQAIDFIGGLADKIRSVLPDLSGLGNIDLNPFAIVPGAPAAQGRAARSGGGGGGGATVVINITGDPASIERSVIGALRTYGRRTGTTFTGIS